MKILVACEFSGRVRDCFIKKGHDAISCDILDTERPGPHYKGDVLDILYDDWDLIIAHPPCTYLARSGVRWLNEKDGRWRDMQKAAKFFNLFLDHPCKLVCVENPIIHCHAKKLLSVPHYTQKVQPYHHGHLEKKSTCLWLKGLPLLRATKNVSHQMIGLHQGDTDKSFWESRGVNRQRNRSRTYIGIAKAMASQWG